MDGNQIERAKAILAMEFLARQINNEDVFNGWLMGGVADGDIPYGSVDVADVPEYYLEPDTFKDIALCFMRRMSSANKNYGLYCGGVLCSKTDTDE